MGGLHRNVDTPAAPMAATAELRELSRTLLLLAIRKKFEPTRGLFRLWCLHLHLTSASHDFFASLVEPLHFLGDGRTGLVSIASGFAIYSCRGPFFVLNLIVPRDRDSTQDLVDGACATLRSFGSVIVDTTPLHCQVDQGFGFGVHPRKFCGSKESLVELCYAPAERLVKCGNQVVEATPLSSARDAIGRGVRPVGATLDESGTERCWHRFGDDVVEFDNAVFRTPAPLVLERPTFEETHAFEAGEAEYVGEGAATLADLRAFFAEWPATGMDGKEPTDAKKAVAREAAIVFLERGDVDPQLKMMVVCHHLNHEAIADATVRMLHAVPGAKCMMRLSRSELMASHCALLFEMAEHMKHPARFSQADFCNAILKLALHAECHVEILDWLLRSAWIGGRLLGLERAVLRVMMHQTRLIGPTIERALARVSGAWSRADANTAVLLRELGLAGFDTLKRLEAYEARNVRQLEALVTHWPTESTEATVGRRAGRAGRSKAARRKSPGHIATVTARPADALASKPTPPATRAALCIQMQARLGCPCALVGSGTFSAESDMDVVVRALASEPFAAAVERVAAFFAVPAPLDLSGGRLTVVRGVFEGVPVDAQVWRGEGVAATDRTESERTTQRALLVTEALDRSTRGEAGDDARLLHRWAAAADAKGNALCRLPGIAVTAMAVVFGRRDGDACDCERLRSMLSALLDVLHDPVGPVVELGVAPAPSARQDRCRSPLVVFVDGVNVAARLTVNTTRMLAFLVRAGLRATPTELLRPEYYRRATRAATVVAARVQPLGAGTVPRTLHAALAKLDGHSLLESVHVEWEGVDLVVRVQLDAASDARHRLRGSGATVEADSGWCVTLRDARGRRWPLAKCDEEPSVDDWRTVRVACNGRETVVPDAAYLTVDVMQHFVAPEWRVAP